MNTTKVIMVRLVMFSPLFKYLFMAASSAGPGLFTLSHYVLAVTRCHYESIQCRRSTAIGRASQIVS